MAAKKQVSREDILDAALEVFRESGMDALNARLIAARAGCSTQPIYLSFAGMDELKVALAEQIEQCYEAFLAREVAEGKMPPYKAYGMAYIRFAKEEPAMFRFLFMRKQAREEKQQAGVDQSTKAVVELAARQLGVSYETALCFHMENWVFVHGIAAMLATSYWDWDLDTVSEMLTDAYLGLKHRFEEKREK